MTWTLTDGALRFRDGIGAEPIVTDGSMALELARRGFAERPPDRYNIEHHVVIERIYHAFLDAGATLLQSNTLHANRYALESARLTARVHEINRRGVWTARQCAGSTAIVAGVMGPTGRFLRPLGPLDPSDATAAFTEQAAALLAAGADIIMLKSFLQIDELEMAIDAVRGLSKDVPLVALKSFPEDGAILAGSFPSDIAARLATHGIDAMGSNGTVGPQRMLGIIQSLRTDTMPLVAIPDVGIPTIVSGVPMYNAEASYVAEAATRLVDHGAAIVGADGGAGIEHVKAIADAVRGRAVGAAPRITARHTRKADAAVEPLPPTNLHAGLGKRLLTTVELDVPRGMDMSSVLDGARYLKEHGIDAVNISDGARARLRMSPIAISRMVQEQTGMECIAHLACRDRNMVGLQSEVLGAHALGVRNILAVTGDPTHIGDFPSATSVYDIDAVGLVRALGHMNGGQDLMGNPLGAPTSFCIACAVNPASDDVEREIDRLAAKAAEGAHVAFSQPVFDAELLDSFLDRIRHIDIRFMLGVIPLRTIRHAEFLHYEVPGMMIPSWVRDRMREAGTDTEAATNIGIELAVDFLRGALDRIDGIYLMPPFKKYDIAVRILRQIQPME
ncbi:MAG: bifunctional homocysteine S-methyltransferase/methylenetetrahydrofolate reductase [Candidatus Kapabacteria bacterium]|nr:bifunctional homocysteine S-methyltransferase/methylenetetrahydrofolate reductase [Candidatus Kapabacteria bacterium]